MLGPQGLAVGIGIINVLGMLLGNAVIVVNNVFGTSVRCRTGSGMR
jgi:hypothetical protein